MSLTLTTEQKVKLTIAPVTAAGKAAKLDGVPVWASSDTSIISLDVAADGLSATLSTTDEIGTSTVSVSADADLGEGTNTIQASIDIVAVHAQASNLGLVAGTPEPK